MASTDVARVVPSQTSPDPAKLVKWSDSPVGCVVIVWWVVVAFILQEFCVTQRVDWPAGADGDRRGGAWITIESWRVASVVLAAGTCLGLALVHFTDPGVVPPNTRGVEPDVAEYLATNRPIYVKPAKHLPDGSSSDADGVEANARDETKTTPDTGGQTSTSRTKTRSRSQSTEPTIDLVLRYAKDWRGQPIRTIVPARLLHHEDPEGPCLFDGRAPEFDPRCVTNTVRDAFIVFPVCFIHVLFCDVHAFAYLYLSRATVLRHVRRVAAAANLALSSLRVLHGTVRSSLPRARDVHRGEEHAMVRGLSPVRRGELYLRVRKISFFPTTFDVSEQSATEPRPFSTVSIDVPSLPPIVRTRP